VARGFVEGPDDGKAAVAARVGISGNVVAISGSLQGTSSNSALLRAIGAAATNVDFTVWDELGELPLFRPDRVGDAYVDSLRCASRTLTRYSFRRQYRVGCRER